MARSEALLRLHQNLTARRQELYKRLGFELRDLGNPRSTGQTGDAADAAFDSGSEEMSSKLAELEARELRQIERAITKMKQGSYGVCELCQIRIPVARLNALPYSTMCVKCQNDVERSSDWEFNHLTGSWENVTDGGDERARVDLSSLEMDLSK
jgi:DnaK suppressor protein